MEWLGQLCLVIKYVLHFYLPVTKMNKNYLNEEDQMHKSLVELPHLKIDQNFCVLKKKKPPTIPV